MSKRLDEYLGEDPKANERFAAKIGVDPFSVRRYRLGEKLARPLAMNGIIKATGGLVLPNDFNGFYNVTDRHVLARYGELFARHGWLAPAQRQAAE